MDLRVDHQLTERTREDDGDVYILGNIVQVFYDGGEAPETYTCLRVEDAQQKFDALTQGWYRNSEKSERDKQIDDEEAEWNRIQDEYMEIGHGDNAILWWYKKGKLHVVEDTDATHDELIGEDVPRGRYDPETHTASFITVQGRGTPQFIIDALEEKFGGDLNVRAFNPPSPLERKSPRELKYGFNAFISPEGEWIQVPADGTTHYEFAVSNLGFQDLNDALYNGYIRVSFSPRGSTFIQVENMEESLPVIVAAVQDLYKEYGSVQIVAEDIDNTYILPLGTLAMANTVADLKENAKDWDTYLRE